jgi:cyclomaltodextrinase / maltogenic alpha-amylase / neopullulanase
MRVKLKTVLVAWGLLIQSTASRASAQEHLVVKPPQWAAEAIWYQVFPERFRNGDPSNDPELEIPGWRVTDWGSDYYKADDWERAYGTIFESIQERRYGGDLQGILDRLDYLQELGITALYINPVFQSPSHHKYNGSSFHHIDPHFGPDPQGDIKLIESASETLDPNTWVWTKADLLYLDLVKEVHRRGMRIIMDGVFNHSGREFFAFKDILRKGRSSQYRDWYDIVRWDPSLPDGFEYRGWFGHKIAPEFKESQNGFHPDYDQYLANITKRWMSPFGKKENGVDGWRLDVAFDVQHQFWKKWRKIVKAINPEAYLTAEIWQTAPEYTKGDEFDALMNYPFAHSVSEFVIDQKDRISPSQFDRLLKSLQLTYPNDSTRVMQNLVASHDTARLRSQIINPDLQTRNSSYNFPHTQIVNNSQYNLGRGGSIHQSIHKLIALIQMTYIGAPMIYYGDEVGMTGANDPDCRKPMLWSDIVYDDEITHPIFPGTALIAKNIIETDLLDYYKMLIRIRKSSRALTDGSFHSFLVDDENGIYGFMRQFGDEKVYVIINSSLEDARARFPLTGTYQELTTNQTLTIEAPGEIPIQAKTGIILREL